jgi:hypothetical protein
MELPDLAPIQMTNLFLRSYLAFQAHLALAQQAIALTKGSNRSFVRKIRYHSADRHVPCSSGACVQLSRMLKTILSKASPTRT